MTRVNSECSTIASLAFAFLAASPLQAQDFTPPQNDNNHPQENELFSCSSPDWSAMPRLDIIGEEGFATVFIHAGNGFGSGVIIDKDQGLIVTNDHVIANIKDGEVITASLYAATAEGVFNNLGAPYEVELIGTDEETDVGVLKINDTITEKHNCAHFGDSNALRVGEGLDIFGGPFGLTHSYSQGKVSSVNRYLPQQFFNKFIQHDGAVNPGNSGGPLFNEKGQIVGINSQIYSKNAQWAGLSFAIDGNEVQETVRALLTKGEVPRGWIGAGVSETSDEQVKQMGLAANEPRGVLFSGIIPDSPADKAGIKAGDVALRVNDKPIYRINSFMDTLEGEHPSTISIKVWRPEKGVMDIKLQTMARSVGKEISEAYYNEQMEKQKQQQKEQMEKLGDLTNGTAFSVEKVDNDTFIIEIPLLTGENKINAEFKNEENHFVFTFKWNLENTIIIEPNENGVYELSGEDTGVPLPPLLISFDDDGLFQFKSFSITKLELVEIPVQGQDIPKFEMPEDEPDGNIEPDDLPNDGGSAPVPMPTPNMPTPGEQ